MQKRDVIKMALRGQRPPYVPWNITFTQEAQNKLAQYYQVSDVESRIDNHILLLGNTIGFFEDVGEGIYRDVFGVLWDRTRDKDIGIVKGQILKEPSLKNYIFPNPADNRFFCDMQSTIDKFSDRFRLYCIGFSLYERAWTLRGMENLLMDFCENPEFVDDLLNKIADYNIAQIHQALKYDIDAVYLGDDWGQQQGLQMGYKHWRRFIYPVLKRMYAEIRKAGKYVFIHSCGDVDELFDDLIGIGLNCFNPFQPEVMDVKALLKRYKGSLSFYGGLSTQQTLPYGNTNDVRLETRHLIEAGAKGNYIFSSAHAIEGDVPLNNILAMLDEVMSQEAIYAR
jgi:uroporphyrinogen decarboxylase